MPSGKIRIASSIHSTNTSRGVLGNINHVKVKIAEIAPGLPVKTMADGSETKVTIVPFYDRSNLIRETLVALIKGTEVNLPYEVIKFD